MNFSLKWLLAGCAYLAVACAGLLTVQSFWAGLTFLLTFLAIILMSVTAWFGPVGGRAGRASFALAAAAYLGLTVYPGQFTGFPTTEWFESLNRMIEPTRNLQLGPPAGKSMMGGMGGGMMIGGKTAGSAFPAGGTPVFDGNQYQAMQTARDNTPRIGHCLFAVLLGLLAAEVGRRAFERRNGRVEVARDE